MVWNKKKFLYENKVLSPHDFSLHKHGSRHFTLLYTNMAAVTSCQNDGHVSENILLVVFLVICPQINGVFWQADCSFSETVPRAEYFFNRQLIAFVWTDEKVFSNTINAIHYPAHALCKGCYHIFIVLAFSCGRAKNESNTLRVDMYFFQNGVKRISVFKNIRILVNEALMLLLRLETQSYGVTILSIFSVKSDDVTIPYESSLAVICAICLK